MPDQTQIEKLYPNLTPEELKEADENLDAYLSLIFRMYERIQNNPAQRAELQKLLTEHERFSTIGAKVEPNPIN